MGKATAPVFRVKISLRDSAPLVWRQILVSSETKLSQFHHIIQIAMGWTNSHLHLFRVGPVSFSYPHEAGDLEEMAAVDERYVKLSHLVPQRRPFIGEFHFEMEYVYDFGDSWEHDIVFEDVLLPDAKQKVPVCVAGENACPPEDSGGIWYYNETLQTRSDGVGDELDDEDLSQSVPFDLEVINRQLKTL